MLRGMKRFELMVEVSSPAMKDPGELRSTLHLCLLQRQDEGNEVIPLRGRQRVEIVSGRGGLTSV